MKKLYLFLAFTFYVAGVAVIIDWYIFWQNNYQGNFEELKIKYVNHFPYFTQSFFASRISTLFFILTFIFAGVIFIKQKNTVYKVIGTTTFIFALWNLYSLL